MPMKNFFDDKSQYFGKCLYNFSKADAHITPPTQLTKLIDCWVPAHLRYFMVGCGLSECEAHLDFHLAFSNY